MLHCAEMQGLNRADAEDVLNDTFEYLMRTSAEKLSNISEENRKALLLIAVKNRAKNLKRKSLRSLPIEAYYIEYDRMQGAAPKDEKLFEGIVEKEIIASVKAALASLGAKTAETLYLHLICGLTAAEIAELIGVKINTVFKRIRVGKRQLRSVLEKDGFIYEE